jgi:RND family efflux transporter MFP subunit
LPLFLLLSFGSAAAAAVPVTVAAVSDLSFQSRFNAPAVVQSLSDTRISAEIAGAIERIPVQVGERIAADALIAELDCSAYVIARDQAEAALDEAKARHQLAVSQLSRVRRLASSNSVAEDELQQRAADVASTRAQVAERDALLRQAARHTENCAVRSPFDGVVVEKYVGVGELVDQGTHLVRVLDTANLEVSAQIQVEDAETLDAGDRAVFETRDGSYPVRLRSAVPMVDTRVGSYEYRFAFVEQVASPGVSGRLVWLGARRYLPAYLLVGRGEEFGVFVERDGVARFVVVPDAREGHPVPVALPPGTRVIVDGRHGLKGGEPVAVAD